MHARAARPSFRRGRHKLKRPGSGARAVRVYRLDAGVALSASSPSSSQLSSSQPCKSPCSNAPSVARDRSISPFCKKYNGIFAIRTPVVARMRRASSARSPSTRASNTSRSRLQSPREAGFVEQRRGGGARPVTAPTARRRRARAASSPRRRAPPSPVPRSPRRPRGGSGRRARCRGRRPAAGSWCCRRTRPRSSPQ